jgi:uncharacterized protein (TIGR03435 family)
MNKIVLTGWLLTLSAFVQPALEFEVASLRPNKEDGGVHGGCHGFDSKFRPPDWTAVPVGRCVISAGRLSHMIGIAWEVDMGQIKGGPEWAKWGFDRFNLVAKAEDAGHTPEAQLLKMLQSLLIERFQLKYHIEEITRPGFALVVGKNGPRMKPSESSETTITPGAQKPTPGQPITLYAHGTPMALLAKMISVNGPVVDHTALTGEYDFTLHWDEDQGPTLATALQEQLGLKLEPAKVPVSLFVIDSAQKPAAAN